MSIRVDHKIVEWERGALREEMRGLKNCQITFLTSAVTATGVLFGLGSTFGESGLGFVPLIPLVVLLPAWWIFFDKATTITRIVGYSRALERILLSDWQPERFPGWERALALSRYEPLYDGDAADSLNWQAKRSGFLRQRIYKMRCRVGQIRCMAPLHVGVRNKYWIISFWIFFGLSLLCLSISCFVEPVCLPLASFAALLILISYLYNTRLLWQLLHGSHSYGANELRWVNMLSRKE